VPFRLVIYGDKVRLGGSESDEGVIQIGSESVMLNCVIKTEWTMRL
jgi:hypothetical protein